MNIPDDVMDRERRRSVEFLRSLAGPRPVDNSRDERLYSALRRATFGYYENAYVEAMQDAYTLANYIVRLKAERDDYHRKACEIADQRDAAERSSETYLALLKRYARLEDLLGGKAEPEPDERIDFARLCTELYADIRKALDT